MKITVDLDPELYRAVKVEAARADRSVRDVIAEAVDSWLTRAEDAEDAVSAEAALREYDKDGGTSAADYFRHLAAEVEATYGTGADESRE